MNDCQDSAPAWAIAMALALIVITCIYLVQSDIHIPANKYQLNEPCDAQIFDQIVNRNVDRGVDRLSPAHGVWQPAARRGGVASTRADGADPYTWPYRDAPGLPGDVGVDVGLNDYPTIPDEALFRGYGVAGVSPGRPQPGDHYADGEAVVDRAPGLHMRSEPDHYEFR